MTIEKLVIADPRIPPFEETPLPRREAVEFRTARGFRTSHSTLTKMCSPAINTGPVSCGK
jgi:hypothetical protein